MTLRNNPTFSSPNGGLLETWEVANGPFSPDSLFIGFGAGNVEGTTSMVFQIGTAQSQHGNHFKPVMELDAVTGPLTLNGVQLQVP